MPPGPSTLVVGTHCRDHPSASASAPHEIRRRSRSSVHAGNGGNGCVEFPAREVHPARRPGRRRRRRRRQRLAGRRRGPQHADRFPPQRVFRAQRGENGMGRQMAGKARRGHADPRAGRHRGHQRRHRRGSSATSPTHGQRLLVAQGGHGGHGNVHFKSSVNRAPRRRRRAAPARSASSRLELQAARRRRPARLPERRQVHLHPRGLGGDAARSPTIRSRRCSRTWAWSASRRDRSFVIADIPGPDRGRCRRRGARHPVPASTSQRTRAAAAPGRHGAVRRASSIRSTRCARSRTSCEVRSRAAGAAALAGAQQGRPAGRGRARQDARKAIVRKLDWKEPWFVVSAIGARGHLAGLPEDPALLRRAEAPRRRPPKRRRRASDGCLHDATASGRAPRAPARTLTQAACAGGHVAQKKPACAGFLRTARVADQAGCSALMCAVRRLLWRAALFLWIRPRAE